MKGPAAHITEHPFLDAAECEALAEALNRNSHLALDRGPASPGCFVTYGRAAYLDVCLKGADPERNYYSVVASSNLGLRSIIGPVLDDLRTAIGDIVGEQTVYLPDQLALPGIHIFRGHGIRSAGEAGAHFNVQYQKLALPQAPDRDAQPISFTVLLRAPACGTGLQVHNVSYQDYERAYLMGRIMSLGELVGRRTSAYYPYAVGTLVVHHGLLVHCIATPGPVATTDERITLQGHGIRCGGTWILYW